MGRTESAVPKEFPVGTDRNTDAFFGAAGGVIEFDALADTITICGVVYAMQIFRSMAIAEPGMWFRIEDRGDRLNVAIANDDCERIFDVIAKKGRFRE